MLKLQLWLYVIKLIWLFLIDDLNPHHEADIQILLRQYRITMLPIA